MRQDIPISPHKHRGITNSGDQSIAYKLEFFGNCIDKMCFDSGEYIHYEVETHLSLIDHLIFIAQSDIDNIHREDHQVRKIANLIQHICSTHPLLSEEDTFRSDDDIKSGNFQSKLDNILNETITRGNSRSSLILFRDNLISIKEEIESIYFDKITHFLLVILCCKHTLHHHRKDFEYLSRLFFSKYYLDGYSRKQISQFVDRVLASNVYRHGDFIYTTKTLLPKELYHRQINHNRNKKPFDQELFNDIQDYLDKRDIKQQIEGFKHLLHYQKHKHHLLFKVDGLNISPGKDNDYVEVLGLKFYLVRDFRRIFNHYDYKYAEDFFSTSNYSGIVEVTVQAFSQDDAIFTALEVLGNKLGKLMRIENFSFAINRSGYTYYPMEEDHGMFNINSMPENAYLSHFSAKNVSGMEKWVQRCFHSSFYLELEYILQQGYLETNPTSALHYFRKFIQTLISKEAIELANMINQYGIPAEIRAAACLLVHFERKSYQGGTRLWVHNKLINAQDFPFRGDELLDEYKKIVYKDGVLLPLARTVQFIPERLAQTKYEASRALYYSRKVNEMDVFEYYCRQLIFIKQYRDKYEHGNITDDLIARKLQLYSYRILARLLQKLLVEFSKKSNKNLSKDQILSNLICSGASLANLHSTN